MGEIPHTDAEMWYIRGNEIVLPGRAVNTPGVSHQEASPMTIPQSTPAPETEQEEWRPVVGYEEWYEVSSHGRVRRIGRARGTQIGHILSLSSSNRGYRQVKLHDGSGYRTRKVHHLVAEAFIDPIPDGMHVNHIDTNRSNNRPGNLEYVTPQGNSRHMVAVGHSLRGERSPHAKLTADDIRAIRSMRQQGVRLKAVARHFGVSPQTVCDIMKGRGWSHVA